MKKSCLVFFLTLPLFTLATHNVGGEIILKQLGYLSYKGTITTYTKSSSAPADRDSLEICWGDGICEWIQRDSSSELGKDIKKNIYTGTHLYSQEGTYTVYMTDPNRNAGILNLNPPISDNVPFHIQTIHVVSSIWNSTPVLLNPPVDLGLTGNSWEHNAAAIDWDGDSIVYSITVPLQGLNDPAPNYILPSAVGPGPNNNINIHSEYGTLTWDSPQLPGLYTVAISIMEYRDGQMLSNITRDFMFVILDGPDIPPVVSIPFNEVWVEVGDTLSVEVTGEDQELADIHLQTFGIPTLLNNNFAVFDAPNGFASPPVAANYEWIIHNEHGALSPYYVVFRLEDQFSSLDCGTTHYQVLKIIIDPSSVGTLFPENRLSFQVYPNPVQNGKLFLELGEAFFGNEMEVQLVDLLGHSILQQQVFVGEKVMTIDLPNLPDGHYFLSVEIDGKQGTSKVLIKN